MQNPDSLIGAPPLGLDSPPDSNRNYYYITTYTVTVVPTF